MALVPGMLALRTCVAILALLSYRLLFASTRELSIAAVLLAVICAVSCTVFIFPEEANISLQWQNFLRVGLQSASAVLRDFLWPADPNAQCPNTKA